MIIQPKSKLVMIGDSVTDCGRKRPVGVGPHSALGDGYVARVANLLMAAYPAHHIRIVNMGISGDTVRDLQNRWQRDVLDLTPDWLSICIGINDVWRHYAAAPMIEDHVPIEEYGRRLEGLVEAARPKLKGLILMTPYYIEPDRTDPMRAMMDDYGTAVRQTAERYSAVLVDTQAAFDTALTHSRWPALAGDRIHPTQKGHMVLARAFLQALGYTGL